MLNLCHYPIPIYIYNGVVSLTHCQIYHTASDFKNVFMKFRTFFYILRTIVYVFLI